jgi:hypothetical protein
MKFNGILPTLSKAFLLINRNANVIMRHWVASSTKTALNSFFNKHLLLITVNTCKIFLGGPEYISFIIKCIWCVAFLKWCVAITRVSLSQMTQNMLALSFVYFRSFCLIYDLYWTLTNNMSNTPDVTCGSGTTSLSMTPQFIPSVDAIRVVPLLVFGGCSRCLCLCVFSF